MERVDEALGHEIPARSLYGILRLRSEVFVVEQACIYLDPDGRDLDPSTRHLWIEHAGIVVAALRVLRDDRGASIGRVVTSPGHRSRGLGARLMKAGLDVAPRPLRVNAQSHLVGWYAGFGFDPDGAEFVEDGIRHSPMVLAT